MRTYTVTTNIVCNVQLPMGGTWAIAQIAALRTIEYAVRHDDVVERRAHMESAARAFREYPGASSQSFGFRDKWVKIESNDY